MATLTRNRWSDNDKHFGPFVYSRDKRRVFSVVLDSGEPQDSPGCSLRLCAFGHTLILELPALIRPWRRWVDTSGYSWSSGSGGYWDEQPREYGFSLSEGFLQVFLGAQTGDSSTEQSWCKFLPWTQWRFVRFSLYDLDGQHFWTELEKDRKRGLDGYQTQREMERQCPTISFEFDDYDGERITVKTHIEEREWLFGTGWFKWLSVFRKPKISRCLDLDFSKEVGPRKGSWKGGTLGHAIEMLQNEQPESAFRRYCAIHNLTFIATKSTH